MSGIAYWHRIVSDESYLAQFCSWDLGDLGGPGDLVNNPPTYGMLMVLMVLMVWYFRRNISQRAYQDSSCSSLAWDELPSPVLGFRHEVSILAATLATSLQTKYLSVCLSGGSFSRSYCCLSLCPIIVFSDCPNYPLLFLFSKHKEG